MKEKGRAKRKRELRNLRARAERRDKTFGTKALDEELDYEGSPELKDRELVLSMVRKTNILK